MRYLAAWIVASAIAVAPSARADEIVPSYLPWWLRGDGVVGVSGRHGYEGPGGALRHRTSGHFAWETWFAYLRGIDDSSARSLPISVRAMFIDARTDRPDWDFHLALGAGFERFISETHRATRLGGEVGIAVDRRIDPVFNRFLVELVLSRRHGLSHEDGYSSALFLRVGIATTFGVSQIR